MWLNDLLLKVFTSAQSTAVADIENGMEMNKKKNKAFLAQNN